MNRFCKILVLVESLLLTSFCVMAANYNNLIISDSIVVKAGHPRILMSAGEENIIREKIESEPFLMNVHNAIIKNSESFLTAPPLERIKIGKRLLDVSRSALKQIYYLSYSWRMTGDDRYAEKAEKVMLDVCSFSDWNPIHYLDVAEMTAAVSIGYDWLYSYLSEDSKQIIRKAIVEKGIEPSIPETPENSKYNHWLKKKNNWNAVCNMGMALGSIAIYEYYPELSRTIIARSINSSQANTLQEYAPDGNYPEGYMYWNYGTAFLIMLSDALETATNVSLGLEEDYAFMRSAEYMAHMTTQDFGCFAYSDCNVKENTLCIPLFWFAKKGNNPSLLYGEEKRINYLADKGESHSLFISRYLPSLMIWADKNCFSDHRPPKNLTFVGQGPTPVALLRNQWGGSNEIFLGLKGGSCNGGHSHMDIGSFVMYRGNKQWAKDLGNQSYYSLEKEGIVLNKKTQNSDRWNAFRFGIYSHNLIIFADSLQRVNEFAKIVKYGEKKNMTFAASDLTAIQGGIVDKYQRGVAIVDNKYVVIRDEISNGHHNTPIRWAMLTPSEVDIISSNTAILKQGDEKMYFVVEGKEVSLQTYSTEPPHYYDAPNPGTIMIGFKANLNSKEKVHFNIYLIPEEYFKEVNPSIKEINKW